MGRKEEERQLEREEKIKMLTNYKLYFFTHSDSFYPRATHCTFLTHARGEISNTHKFHHLHTDGYRLVFRHVQTHYCAEFQRAAMLEKHIEKNFSKLYFPFCGFLFSSYLSIQFSSGQHISLSKFSSNQGRFINKNGKKNKAESFLNTKHLPKKFVIEIYFSQLKKINISREQFTSRNLLTYCVQIIIRTIFLADGLKVFTVKEFSRS